MLREILANRLIGLFPMQFNASQIRLDSGGNDRMRLGLKGKCDEMKRRESGIHRQRKIRDVLPKLFNTISWKLSGTSKLFKWIIMRFPVLLLPRNSAAVVLFFSSCIEILIVEEQSLLNHLYALIQEIDRYGWIQDEEDDDDDEKKEERERDGEEKEKTVTATTLQ